MARPTTLAACLLAVALLLTAAAGPARAQAPAVSGPAGEGSLRERLGLDRIGEPRPLTPYATAVALALGAALAWLTLRGRRRRASEEVEVLDAARDYFEASARALRLSREDMELLWELAHRHQVEPPARLLHSASVFVRVADEEARRRSEVSDADPTGYTRTLRVLTRIKDSLDLGSADLRFLIHDTTQIPAGQEVYVASLTRRFPEPAEVLGSDAGGLRVRRPPLLLVEPGDAVEVRFGLHGMRYQFRTTVREFLRGEGGLLLARVDRLDKEDASSLQRPVDGPVRLREATVRDGPSPLPEEGLVARLVRLSVDDALIRSTVRLPLGARLRLDLPLGGTVLRRIDSRVETVQPVRESEGECLHLVTFLGLGEGRRMQIRAWLRSLGTARYAAR
ncbi:MAG: hypothetical protein HY722_05665 [Planctomycetes bacterium]|nr:hypothetical protein [Planctomycetota bacterium]